MAHHNIRTYANALKCKYIFWLAIEWCAGAQIQHLYTKRIAHTHTHVVNSFVRFTGRIYNTYDEVESPRFYPLCEHMRCGSLCARHAFSYSKIYTQQHQNIIHQNIIVLFIVMDGGWLNFVKFNLKDSI